MVSNSYSYKNAQQGSARLNQPKKVLVKTTPTPNITNTPSQVLALVPIPNMYTQKDLQRITKLCINLFLKRNHQEEL